MPERPAPTIRTSKCSTVVSLRSWVSGTSFLHEGIQFRRGNRMVEIGECALVLHFARRINQSGLRRPLKRGGEADQFQTLTHTIGSRQPFCLATFHTRERLHQ